MGARRIRANPSIRPDKHGRLLGAILFGIATPLFLGAFLISLDIKPGLENGQPRIRPLDGAPLAVGWPALQAENADAGRRPLNGAVIQMLGYMMDGYEYARDGTPVRMFVLMPSAGHLLHPAHRVPDDMVEVWPKTGTITFRSRELVHVTGIFEHLEGAREEHAMYALRDASVEFASQRDLAAWFAR